MLLCMVLLLRVISTANGHADQDNIRNITFYEPLPDHALVGHVIANRTVDTLDQCQIECFLIAECTSLNFDTSPLKSPNCQLIKSKVASHMKQVIKQIGNIYQDSRNECFHGACTNAHNTVCQSGFGRLGYRCICRKCFTGDNCTKYINDIVLNYPQRATVDQYATKYVNFQEITSHPIQNLTISLWLQINSIPDDTIKPTAFSFENKENKDELSVFFEYTTKLLLDFQGTARFLEYDVPEIFDGRWHHIAIWWSKAKKTFFVYIDGHRKNAKAKKTFEYRDLKKELRFVLGQEQDDYTNGDYNSNQSFQGNITGFNMWDREFNDSEISTLAKESPFKQEGNLMKWREIVPLKSASVKHFCGLNVRRWA